MPGVSGHIWVDSDGKFIVDETGDVLILIPQVSPEPVVTWTEESGLPYESWDTEE